MSEKDRMLAGRLYRPFDQELGRDNKKARILTRLFNGSSEEQQEYRKTLLKQLFKSADNIYIEPLAEQYRKEIQSEQKEQ